jgi:hypothetical protein
MCQIDDAKHHKTLCISLIPERKNGLRPIPKITRVYRQIVRRTAFLWATTKRDELELVRAYYSEEN